MLEKSDIQKFQALYLQRFNMKLSDEDALGRLNALLEQVRLIYTCTGGLSDESKRSRSSPGNIG